MKNCGSEVIKGRGPDGVSYSSLTLAQIKRCTETAHAYGSGKKKIKKKIDVAALLSAVQLPSPIPSSLSLLLLSKGMWQLDLKAEQLCLPTVC